MNNYPFWGSENNKGITEILDNNNVNKRSLKNLGNSKKNI